VCNSNLKQRGNSNLDQSALLKKLYSSLAINSDCSAQNRRRIALTGAHKLYTKNYKLILLNNQVYPSNTQKLITILILHAYKSKARI